MNIHIRKTRRKYGEKSWFCWVEIYHDDRWIPALGDPWPVRNPPQNEVLLAVSETVLRYGLEGGPKPSGRGIETVQIPED